MTTAELAKLIGRRIELIDVRSGVKYPTVISQVRSNYGFVEIQCENGRWFRPNESELAYTTPLEDTK